MRGLNKRMPSHKEIDVSMCNGILRIWLGHVAHLLISLNHRMRGLNHLIISSAHLICSSHLLISSAHLICSSHLILLLLLLLLSLCGLKTSCVWEREKAKQIQAKQSKAMHSKAQQSKAKQSKAQQSKAKHSLSTGASREAPVDKSASHLNHAMQSNGLGTLA